MINLNNFKIDSNGIIRGSGQILTSDIKLNDYDTKNAVLFQILKAIPPPP